MKNKAFFSGLVLTESHHTLYVSGSTQGSQRNKGKFAHVLIESSGGVTEENVIQLTGPHVDIISSSKTTQGYDVVDFSLKIQKEGRNPENPLVSTN